MQNSFSHIEFDKAIKSTNKEENRVWKLNGFGLAFWEWKRLD